jgi:hypothetical protein
MPKPIKYGVYDGFATRFTSDGEIWVCYDGKWHREVSHIAKLISYDIGVLSEERYHRAFGSVPPLPPAAFGDASPTSENDPYTTEGDPWQRAKRRTTGWSSPLV